MIVGPELTAIITRLLVFSVLTAETIQWPERRSYSTPGSVGSEPLSTDDQKVASLTLSAPRFPCLSNTLSRPFSENRIWVGPTEPIESGGIQPDSLLCTPRNEVPADRSEFGPIASPPV